MIKFIVTTKLHKNVGTDCPVCLIDYNVAMVVDGTSTRYNNYGKVEERRISHI